MYADNHRINRAGSECMDRGGFGYSGREHAGAQQYRSQDDPEISDVRHARGGSETVAKPRQRANRQRLSSAARMRRPPTGRAMGSNAQPRRPAWRPASAIPSSNPWLAGSADAPRLTSQFRVNAGIIRPPIAVTNARTATMASRQPSPTGSAKPASSRCVSRSAIPSSAIGRGIIRLRQFRAAMICRPATTQSRKGNASLTTVANQSGMSVETRQMMRPRSQTATSPASIPPRIGRRPVQFGIAVRMKLPMAA